VNHEDPEALARLTPFDRLVVTHPDRRYVLETTPDEVAMRVLDLFCPLGRGQRQLIVSPPRAGKTILLQKIADSVARNDPEAEIVVLLVDERPEEVTNMRRSVRGEVIASTFDQPPHRHIRVAELAIEKVKRMVEFGRHVVLLLDSLTRLGRAYNNEADGNGRLLTGGLEASALTKPKRFFGAARNIEHGGSLTIVATALVDTGSRLDQVIFEEFKGTGNSEIVLSREIANQRVWPAIDAAKSGTRREDLLLHPDEQRRITTLRREMLEQPPDEAMLDLLERMEKYKSNAELLMRTSPS
jgi:transcription termination factor Rho